MRHTCTPAPRGPADGSTLQSKRGSLWNNQPLQTENWSALIKFRVSGQGKQLFGDGFAFWVAKGARFMEGPFFGVTDRFQGANASPRAGMCGLDSRRPRPPR